jgi:hypothetical protein
LQERAGFRAGNGDDGAIVQESGFHDPDLRGGLAVAKGGMLG